MSKYIWDGPEDSDEEVHELLFTKSEYEKKKGIKFSKRGIIDYVEKVLAYENPLNKKDAKNSKLWEEKVKIPQMKMYLKKGGSELSKDQPFMRTENTFNKKY